MPSIPGQEIAELLRKAISGEVSVSFIGRSWSDMFCGDVEFQIGGYRILIFNDCDELDYVDKAVAPDGRTGEFDSWFDLNAEPISLLSQDEQSAIEKLLVEADLPA